MRKLAKFLLPAIVAIAVSPLFWTVVIAGITIKGDGP